MSKGLDNLRHLVVLMMENRSFDHMLGALKAVDPRIEGLTGKESNPDTTNEPAPVRPQAQFQGQLDPDPDHSFPAVNKQLFFPASGPPAKPAMQGFVQSYWDQQRSVSHSRKIMYYFPPEKLPVITTLARSYAVFNGWFSSIPGPTVCNRAFAHYGTSFGKVDLDIFYLGAKFQSIYQRMKNGGKKARVYYFDPASSTQEVVNLLGNQPQFFGTFEQFLDDCRRDTLPDYCFVEPNYSDHTGDDGTELLASDQHPDHDVQSGEQFIASVYNAIQANPKLRENTALLITYDEHGGIYDHVSPPALDPAAPDGFLAPPEKTGTGFPFAFDRLGVRVPSVLVSPWIPKGTVIAGPEDPVNGRVFEHASIPNTVMKLFGLPEQPRTKREAASATFLDYFSDNLRPASDCPVFVLD